MYITNYTKILFIQHKLNWRICTFEHNVLPTITALLILSVNTVTINRLVSRETNNSLNNLKSVLLFQNKSHSYSRSFPIYTKIKRFQFIHIININLRLTIEKFYHWNCTPPCPFCPSWLGSSIGGNCGWNCSADNLVNRIPTPSIKANRTPPMKALPAMAPNPFLAARIPPVAAPLMIEFQGSSFFLTWINAQSIVENIPPHTAKLPAIIGDLCLMAVTLPSWN